MSRPLSYNESFIIIKRTKDTNVALMDTIIKKLEDFSGSIQLLLSSLSKISFELPTRREKRSIFERKSLFKRDKDPITFENMEPQFNLTWEKFATLFLNKQTGLYEFNEDLKSKFITEFRLIRNDYEKELNSIEQVAAAANKILQSAESAYNQANATYKSHCILIEDLKNKIDVETNSGRTVDPKMMQLFVDIKAEYITHQENVVNALATFNEQKAQYQMQMESCLSIFEKADFKRETKMQELFSSFSEPITQFAQKKDSAAQELNKMVENLDPDEELLPLFQIQCLQENYTTLSFEGTHLPFEISEIISPLSIFEKEMKFYGAKIIKSQQNQVDGDNLLNIDDVVTVIETDDQNCRVFNEKTNFATTIPLENIERIPSMDRKIFKVIESFPATNNSEMSVNKGEVVLSLKTKESHIFCLNAYNKRGHIPIDHLEPYVA